VTPLVYEERGNTILVASARGHSADWLHNIRANPKVIVRVGRRQFDAVADVTSDPEEIANYLQRQIDRNPTAFGAILRSEGLSSKPSRADLIQFAPKRPMVTIHPLGMPPDTLQRLIHLAEPRLQNAPIGVEEHLPQDCIIYP